MTRLSTPPRRSPRCRRAHGPSGCGGSGTAAEPKAAGQQLLGEKLTGMVGAVDKMGIVEWHGQMLTKSPDKGGRRILDLAPATARPPATARSRWTRSSTATRAIDYLVVNDRTYFNSEPWGPGSNDCWATSPTTTPTRGLPSRARPQVGTHRGRALSADGEDVNVSLGYKDVLAGLPQGPVQGRAVAALRHRGQGRSSSRTGT